jgi:RNA recognition motif-containing protein
MKLFVGNLSFRATEEAVRFMFETHGKVESVSMMTDRDTLRSRGFGFVEMPNDAEAQRAITALGGRELHARSLTVNEARPKAERGFGDGAFRANSGHPRSEARW